jgi:hypothetical protein
MCLCALRPRHYGDAWGLSVSVAHGQATRALGLTRH